MIQATAGAGAGSLPFPLNPYTMLFIGDSGTGKTHGTTTALNAGFKVRYLSADPNCFAVVQKALREREVLVKAGKLKPLEPGQLGICVPDRAKRTAADFAATHLSSLTKSTDAAFKTNPVTRAKFNRFVNIVKATSEFVDTLSGEPMGTIDDWGTDTLFIVDSLSTLCESIMAHTVGDKVAISQPEWGIMQGILMQWLQFLTEDIGCHFGLIAHPNKEVDPTLGVQRIYANSLGQALNTRIPSKFSEVVWCYTTEDKGKLQYWWATKDRLCVTRYTNLPCSSAIPQDMELILRP